MTTLRALFIAMAVGTSVSAASAALCRPLRLLWTRCIPVREARPEPSAPAPAFPAVDKDLRVNVKALADLLKRGDASGARKFADLVAKDIEELSDLMHLYRARNKGGLGWSSTPQANPVMDSLERQLLRISAPGVPVRPLGKELGGWEESGYWIMAMAELTLAKMPPKGNLKVRQIWLAQATQVQNGGRALANAAKAGDAVGVTKAAASVTNGCNGCHAVFK